MVNNEARASSALRTLYILGGRQNEHQRNIWRTGHVQGALDGLLNTMNKGQAAKEGIALTDFGSLLPNWLCEAVEALSRAHDHAPVLPVLGNDLQHLRRKVLRLIGAEPILHLINAGDHALNAILIANEQPPIIQLRALTLQGKVSNALRFWVFFLPAERLLCHGYCFAVPLPAGEDDAALIAEELRIASKIICYHLFWQVVEEIFPEGRFRYADMLALFETSAGAIRANTVNQAAQAEEQEHTAEECQGELEQSEKGI